MKLDNKIATALLNLAKKNNVIVFILFVFLALCYGYYSSIDMGIPPDEFAHMGYIYDVVKNGFPNYSAGFIYETDKYNYLPHPALYYFITGNIAKLYHLFDVYSTRPLRIINILTSMGTLLVIYAALNKMGIRKSSIFLALIILLCIPMFILLSASINNDTLMIFGCALVTYSLVLYYYHATTRKVIGYLLLGCVITALSKATGALSMVCMISVFIIIQNVKLKKFIFNLKILDFFLIIFSISCVAIYFLIVYKHFGKLFPAPQGDPSDWFLVMKPNMPRMNIYENIAAFAYSNVFSLTSPYGYKHFNDLPLRVSLLKLCMASLPIFTITSCLILRREKSLQWQIPFIFLISFSLFTLFYFLTVRGMHLKTGYTGAMQARYFFGFLPAAIIIYALAIDQLKIRVLEFLIAIIFITTLALSFYPAYISLFPSYYGQDTADTPYIELTSSENFEQNFISEYNTLSKVDLFLGTYRRVNTSDITLQIIDNKNKTVASKKINAATIEDNSWVSFIFNGEKLNIGDIYKLRLTSTNSSQGNAITWATYLSNTRDPHYYGTPYGPPIILGDRYNNGIALSNGKKMDFVFVFKIYKKSH